MMSEADLQPDIKIDEAIQPGSPAQGEETSNDALSVPSPSAEPKSTPVKSETKISIKEMEAQNSYIADKQEFNTFKQYFDRHAGAIRTFSAQKHCISISPDEEHETANNYLCDEPFIANSLALLEDKHILVLTGEPELGKTTTAIYLAYLLRQKLRQEFRGTYLVPPLDSSVKIDLRELPAKKAGFSRRAVIFKDVFAHSNQDIKGWFTHLDSHLLREFSNNLKQAQTFLILTADLQTVREQQKQFSQLEIGRSLPELSETDLLRGFSRRLETFAVTQGNTLADLGRISLDDRKQVVQRLRTMPRITQFVKEYLPEICAGRIETLEAVRRFDNLKNWFLAELPVDFEAWCGAFSLAVCQCLPESDGVSWLEFDTFRRAFSKQLERELKITQPPELPFKDVISEETLLEKCRAEVYKDHSTGIDKIRFLNKRYPERLWHIILTSARQAISLVYPVIIQLAASPIHHIRERAAQILGRLGEIDPPHITGLLLRNWVDSGDKSQWANVGYLYQGILASSNKSYREDCLEALFDLGRGDDKRHVWTAVAAYKQIGHYNLALSLEKIKEIAERRLISRIEDTRRIDKILNRVENTLADLDLEAIDALTLAVSHKILSDLAERVYAEEGVALVAIQYALVELSLQVDPLQVFDELAKWVTPKQEALGAILALMFLQNEGIADELRKKQIGIVGEDDENTEQKCPPLILSFASGETKVKQMAIFLEKIFGSFSDFFPPRSRRYLRRSFLLHLKQWATDSLSVPRCFEATAQLAALLMSSKNDELSQQIYHLLQGDKDFIEPDAKLFQFAKRVFELSLF